MIKSQKKVRNEKFNNRFDALRKFIKFDIIDYATIKSKSTTNFEIEHIHFENKALKLLSKIEDVYVHQSLSILEKEVFLCIDLAKKYKENDFQNLTNLRIKLNKTLKLANEIQKEIFEEMISKKPIPLITLILLVVIIIIIAIF